MTIILAETKGYKLCRNETTGKLYYHYEVNKYIGFCFSLLCEVGQPYTKWFLKKLAKLNIKPVSVETETDYFEIDSNFKHLYK